MATAVRIKGLREVQRALRQVDRQLAKDFKNELKQAGEPVARSAASKLSQWRGASTNVGIHVMARSVVARQERRKVTGQRGDFGALQMRRAFIPALMENQDRIERELEQALDRFIRKAGF